MIIHFVSFSFVEYFSVETDYNNSAIMCLRSPIDSTLWYPFQQSYRLRCVISM